LLRDSDLGNFSYSVQTKIYVYRVIPAQIEQISNEAWIREILNLHGIKEDSEVGELLERTILVCVIGVIY
jgi:hypothetical protein